LALATALMLLVGCGGDSDSAEVEAGSVSIDVAYLNGVVDDGSRRQVANGTEVTLTVTSDVAERVHVHGVDQIADVDAGSPARFVFEANLAGVWEVELEDSGRLLFELQIDR
jgi:hypothetical protein